MSDPRLVVYMDVMELDTDEPVSLGDTGQVIRGAGPREGDWMGTFTVAGFDEDGHPELEVSFGK